MISTKQQKRVLNSSELAQISGGHSEGESENSGFWYNAGKFFAEQFNASDDIYKHYGNTNQNHLW